MRCARRLAASFFIVFALIAAASRADDEAERPDGRACSQVCQERNAQCRKACSEAAGTSEEQMICRSRCVDEGDQCRCDCGERAWCSRGNKGLRGCNVLVASRDGQPNAAW